MKEQLAEYAHKAWSGWMAYLFSVSQNNVDGSVRIPAWAVDRWTRKMKQPYERLTEKEKDSDRNEADIIMQIISKVGHDRQE